jgi:hypothetical protein
MRESGVPDGSRSDHGATTMKQAVPLGAQMAARWLLVAAFAAVGSFAGDTALATTAVSVTAVTLSTHDVAVDGASVSSAVIVTARVVSAKPIVSGPDTCGGADSPFVRLAGPNFQLWDASFVRTAGSAADGTWTAAVPVTAAWNGDWHVVGIDAEDGGGSCDTALEFTWQPAVANEPAYALHVTGTNTAHVAVTLAPDPAPWTASHVSFSGRVALSDGTPLGGKDVHVCSDSECGLGRWVATTRADGTFAPITVPLGALIYYWVNDDVTATNRATRSPSYVLTTSIQAVRAVHLTARPNVTRLSLGRYLDISGSIGQVPLAMCNTLRVQRYAAGHWHDVPATVRVGQPALRTVGTARVWLSDYRFHLRTVTRGNVRYRVRFPDQPACNGSGAYTGAVSATIVVGVP